MLRSELAGVEGWARLAWHDSPRRPSCPPPPRSVRPHRGVPSTRLNSFMPIALQPFHRAFYKTTRERVLQSCVMTPAQSTARRSSSGEFAVGDVVMVTASAGEDTEASGGGGSAGGASTSVRYGRIASTMKHPLLGRMYDVDIWISEDGRRAKRMPVDVVMHCEWSETRSMWASKMDAGVGADGSHRTMHQAHLEATRHLIEACKQHGVVSGWGRPQR